MRKFSLLALPLALLGAGYDMPDLGGKNESAADSVNDRVQKFKVTSPFGS